MAYLFTAPKFQAFAATGNPLAGGKVHTYAAGTSTPKATYTTQAGDTANANPVILDANGCAQIWLGSGAYKFVVTDASDVAAPFGTVDNIVGDQLAADLADATNAANGAGQVGFRSSLAYAPATVGAALVDRGVAVTDSPYLATGDGTTDDTAAIQAAMDAHLHVTFPPGSYRITNKLTMRSGHHLRMGPGVTITQATADTEVFYAISKDKLTLDFDGALLIGEGTWSAGWAGNGGHNDRGIHLVACTNVVISRPRIRDCGHAGIAMIGGSGILIDAPRIEGTHAYSTALSASANFQHGIYFKHDPTYGAVQQCLIRNPDISGTAQGILVELEVGAAQPDEPIIISDALIHNIPGQHGFYITCGNVLIDGAALSDIALAGVKVQAGDANLNIENVSATGVIGRDLGSQLFEVAVPSPFTGIVKGIRLQGVGVNVARGASLARRVQNATVDVIVESCTDAAVQVDGADMKDLDIKVQARDVGTDGVLVLATNSTGIKIRPTLRECNAANNATACGIRVETASAAVEVIDPDVTDADSQMKHGLFNAIAGSVVKVRGSATFTGAADTAVRATGLISEFPTEANLSGANGPFTTLENIGGAQAMVVRATSTSASNVVLWVRNLPDESAYRVTVELTGKLADSSQRKSVTLTGTFYRDGGGVATQQGSTTETASHASGSFGGAYNLTVNGAEGVVLQVNSGGAATYGWTARVVAVPVV